VLRYALEHGEAEAGVIRGSFSAKQPLPKWIQEAPELFLGLDFYFTAFWKLSRDRSAGFGPGPIPYSSLMNYAKYLNLDEEETEDFCYFLSEMDSEFLAYASEKSEAERKKSSLKSRKK
jgi:hypothetical protein